MFQSSLEIMDNHLSIAFDACLESTGEKDFSNLKLNDFIIEKERKLVWFYFYHGKQQLGGSIVVENEKDCDYAINAIKSKFNYSHL